MTSTARTVRRCPGARGKSLAAFRHGLLGMFLAISTAATTAGAGSGLPADDRRGQSGPRGCDRASRRGRRRQRVACGRRDCASLGGPLGRREPGGAAAGRRRGCQSGRRPWRNGPGARRREREHLHGGNADRGRSGRQRGSDERPDAPDDRRPHGERRHRPGAHRPRGRRRCGGDRDRQHGADVGGVGAASSDRAAAARRRRRSGGIDRQGLHAADVRCAQRRHRHGPDADRGRGGRQRAERRRHARASVLHRERPGRVRVVPARTGSRPGRRDERRTGPSTPRPAASARGCASGTPGTGETGSTRGGAAPGSAPTAGSRSSRRCSPGAPTPTRGSRRRPCS